MRIISGKARGTKLETLDGTNTRPTLDRVKEAVFNIIQDEIEDAVVLDLFSGSGALALESISRGAAFAYSCDISKKAIEIIKKNITKTHFENKVKVINKDYKKALEELKNTKFDMIFLDPPYDTDYGINAIKMITEYEMLEQDGTIVFETDNEDKYIKEIEKYINIRDIRKYGRVSLIFLNH